MNEAMNELAKVVRQWIEASQEELDEIEYYGA